ncbi:hypothetical protein CR492_19780 [Methylocella silvestris]|uniref:Uncharacterized protein n=1 Tax=Methylocella silvestris TaxID=199596 RepID=A0A2J7TBT5_METSI|nr:hypothetical protein CR492_19780 [Methylocella silvestris]
MQWIRFDARFEERIEEAHQKWRDNLPTHDAKEPDPRQLVEGPKTNDAVARLVDRRFIEYLREAGIPFERP